MSVIARSKTTKQSRATWKDSGLPRSRCSLAMTADLNHSAIRLRQGFGGLRRLNTGALIPPVVIPASVVIPAKAGIQYHWRTTK